MADASDINPFQSTLPARGATQRRLFCLRHLIISIHAPRTGSDTISLLYCARATISIHAPRTGSDLPKGCSLLGSEFQSTLPARGATARRQGQRIHKAISIHAPRTGSDRAAAQSVGADWHFNPRSPHGERPSASPSGISKRNFNPRSPHGERRWNCQQRMEQRHFNPRSPHGERRSAGERISHFPPFQSTLPARGATRRWPTS